MNENQCQKWISVFYSIPFGARVGRNFADRSIRFKSVLIPGIPESEVNLILILENQGLSLNSKALDH